MIKRILSVIIQLFVLVSALNAQVLAGRETVLFDFDWKFYKASVEGAETSDFNDKNWRTVNLPHDWSIEDLPVANDDSKTIINLSNGNWKFMRGDDMSWKEPRTFEGNWDIVEIPMYWDKYPFYEANKHWGWFRRSIGIPNEAKGQDIWIKIGRIADADEIYFNGKLIGSKGQMPPSFIGATSEDRIYKVPNSAIAYGQRNVIAIRVYSESGMGGIYEGTMKRIVSGPFDSTSPGGRSTAFTIGGIGWYRKTFFVGETDKNRAFRIVFDGVYMNSQVWVNGHSLGVHPNGYTSFSYDITKYIKNDKENVIAVKVSNTGVNSRWYSGSGIYRHVWLVKSEKIFHDENHCIVLPVEGESGNSKLNFTAGLKNITKDTTLLRWRVEIENSDGQQVAIQEDMVNVLGDKLQQFNMTLAMRDIKLWSLQNPNLYTLRSTLYSGIKPMDGFVMRFGFRSINFSADNGFLLNGTPVLLKGACIHHDNGALGACAFDEAEYRKIKLLKDAGYNAIRTVHNPPSSALLDACDEIGMLVINEGFDVWQKSKKPQDYHLFFKDYWEKDVESMVMRDRNHPSVIMWSIGNDIPESFDLESDLTAGMLVSKIKSLDPTRPVTAALEKGRYDWSMGDKFFDTLDVAGYSYYMDAYENDHKRKPNRIMYAAESFPAESYNYWKKVESLPYVIGDFVWAGIDYLGEAGKGWWSFKDEPKNMYPWTTAYCGDLDITGQRRPQWFFRNTLWSDKPVVKLLVKNPNNNFGERERIAWGWDDVVENWSWSGYEGLFFDAVIYSNCDEVKLFNNGVEISGAKMKPSMKNTAVFMTQYQPGVLTAVGINNGQTVTTSTLRTAESPTFILLKPSKNEIFNDGQDLVFINVELRDDNDILCPHKDIPLMFQLEGPGEIVAIANANPQNIESFKGPVKTTYMGKCQVIIRASREHGDLTLTVSDQGFLKPGKIKLQSVRPR